MNRSLLLLSLAVLTSAHAEPELVLHPSPGSQGAPLAAFYEAVPLARGEWKPGKEPTYWRAGKSGLLRAVPKAFWPDGSVRWVGMEGVLREVPSGPVTLSRVENPEPLPPATRLSWEGGELVLSDAEGGRLMDLVPWAEGVPITLPKAVEPDTPDDLDGKGQYSWAAPRAALHPESDPESIPLEVREGEVEEETPLYTVYRVRGRGVSGPGREIEWQARIQCEHAVPLVRVQWTWVLGMDADRYALASAGVRLETPLDAVEAGGQPRLELVEKAALRLVTQPNGVWRAEASGTHPVSHADPDVEAGIALLEGGSRKWALAVADFNVMGPNHLAFTTDGVELATWSGADGLALDLRRSSGSNEDDFGISGIDLKSNGTGFARTTEFTLFFGGSRELRRSIAAQAVRRDGIWLPTAEALERTAALGPFSRETLAANPAYFAGLHANLRFVLASRERWRWFGYANFGDWRTNFAYGDNPARGLSAGRWALNGRYGWRNGSGTTFGATLPAALFLEDRALALASLDYARHVTDVDVRHGSFWRPLRGQEGGMHRRNRDHWSGSVQMQYTSSDGIYLGQWLTGDRRLSEVLAEIRDFGRRSNTQTPALSYGALSWIHRYAETHDPTALTEARRLLEGAAAEWNRMTGWAAQSPDYPLGSIYYKNSTRRVSEGMKTLIDFYEATGDRTYLDTVREMVVRDGNSLRELSSPVLGGQGVIGYLLSNGVSRDALGEPLLSAAAKGVRAVQPEANALFDATDYATLAEVVREKLPPSHSPAYRETNSIGRRAGAAFLALRWFGNPPPSFQP